MPIYSGYNREKTVYLDEDSPEGHAFQTSSFTLPMVASGSKDMVLLFPDTRRNVSSVWGISGGAGGAVACSGGLTGELLDSPGFVCISTF